MMLSHLAFQQSGFFLTKTRVNSIPSGVPCGKSPIAGVHPTQRTGGETMTEQPQEQSGEQMVTIERFRDMLQAEMAKGRLDSAGIRCFLAGENAGLLYGNGLDGVLLQVSAAEEDDARAILNDPGTTDEDVTAAE